ncbi:multidrug/Oligosaccharidyl-lipid/Polysaccharide flippase [Cylindrobasidium torrendii FP15055 ss-10]|uniref:Multidrug/Oligosaccharidyl-lipid/Polysaccharide flippase n=1 Tax=Cylindrobasidium torrendii FP15055 ss-10 TaxID=1314674 RepID=A0A0D7B0S3_9AGAR|nr:multidrug/Oligosaccharidyl-lipid/Polysaccharide flippase [Cylindrobasidium torrendii FP15055 ss-10]
MASPHQRVFVGPLSLTTTTTFNSDHADVHSNFHSERTPLLRSRPRHPTKAPLPPTSSDDCASFNSASDDDGSSTDAEDRLVDESHLDQWDLWKQETWNLLKYGIPVFGTQLLEQSLTITSVISVGHVSTSALAAVTLGSMTANVTGLSILHGFASALDTMLPSAWTSEHPELVGLWCQRMAIILAVLCAPIITVWMNAESILLVLKQDAEVARLAAVYLRWLCLGLPAYAFNCIARRQFQSIGLFSAPTQIILIVAPVNVFLNWFLVWGPQSVRLGYVGAAVATAVSFNLIALLSLLYWIFLTPAGAWHPLSSRMFESLPLLMKLGAAGVGQIASEWWAWELIGLAASLLGPVALAVQSVLLETCSTTYQAPFALSMATSVRIGNLLGERNARRADAACKTSLLISLVFSVVSCTALLALRHSWARLFSDSEEVISMTAEILPIVAIFQVFDGAAGVVNGIMRARGIQITGAVLNLTAYYVVGIPLGLVLTFKAGMGLDGLWYGITLALVYCSVVGGWICLRTNWVSEVEKTVKRLEHEKKKHEEATIRSEAATLHNA